MFVISILSECVGMHGTSLQAKPVRTALGLARIHCSGGVDSCNLGSDLQNLSARVAVAIKQLKQLQNEAAVFLQRASAKGSALRPLSRDLQELH